MVNLSDRETAFQISDRLSFIKFLGIGIEDNVPDATTIENFRHYLESRNAHKVLTEVLDNYFCKIGLIKKEGFNLVSQPCASSSLPQGCLPFKVTTPKFRSHPSGLSRNLLGHNLIDATFLRSKGKPHKDEEKNIDIDAQFGHKGYGYSGTINMDEKTKLIRKTTVTSAEILDFQSTEDVLIEDEIKVYADKGYAPARKILQIKYPKTRFHIMYKRNRGKKGEPTPALDENKQLRNISYAKIRARVEHVFSKIKFVFKFQRLRYVSLDRVTAKFNSLCIAYNFSRLGFLMRKQGITV